MKIEPWVVIYCDAFKSFLKKRINDVCSVSAVSMILLIVVCLHYLMCNEQIGSDIENDVNIRVY